MLDSLSVILFFLAFIFIFFYGMYLSFIVGQIGITQILYYIQGAPSQTETEKNKDIQAAIGVATDTIGIPTSLLDLAISLSPIAWVKSSLTFLDSFYSRQFAYLFYIFGSIHAKILALVGLPILVLYVFLAYEGHNYSESFFESIGLSGFSIIGVWVVACLVAYSIGRIMGSPQRTSNSARQDYEKIVRICGYWFDNRSSNSECFARNIVTLRRIVQTFEKMSKEILTKKPPYDDLTIQRLMVLQYQLALAQCTAGLYDDAYQAIQQAKKYLNMLENSLIWEPDEQRTSRSQFLFLEGEINYVLGRFKKAKDLFTQSLKIDKALNDTSGVSINQKRLGLFPE